MEPATHERFRIFETTDIETYLSWAEQEIYPGVRPATLNLRPDADFSYRSEIASLEVLSCKHLRTIGLEAEFRDIESRTWRLVFPLLGPQAWSLAGARAWALTAREYLLIPPGETFSFTCAPVVRQSMILDLAPDFVASVIEAAFDRPMASMPNPICGPHAKTSLRPALAQVSHWITLMRTAYTANICPLLADSIARAVILTAMADWYPRVTPHDYRLTQVERHHPAVTRAIAYLREHYVDAVTLDALAKASGMNKFGLCRLFRRVTGEPPMRYLYRLRLESAHRLLQQGARRGETVTNIAHTVGFQDASHFTRLFKNHYNSTPQTILRGKKSI